MKALDVIIGAVSGLLMVVVLLGLSVQLPSLGLSVQPPSLGPVQLPSLGLSVQLPLRKMWFYKLEFDKNGTYDAMRMSEEELDGVAESVIAYLDGSDPDLSDTTAVVGGTERLFFNQKEISHMEDVRVLFSWGLIIKALAGVFVTAALVYFAVRAFRARASGVGRGVFRRMLGIWRGFAVGTLVLFGVLAALIAANFDRAFTLFHEIFFSNELWLLNPKTDLLINMLPNAFFQDIAVTICGLFVGFMILLIALTTLIRMPLKRHER